jgi:hypothetical protein
MPFINTAEIDVKRKLRLLRYIGKVLPECSLVLQAKSIERFYDYEISRARNHNERESLISARRSEAGDLWLELDQLRSRKLVRKARKMYIDTADLKWQDDHYGNRSLTDESQSKLFRLLKEEQRKDREFLIKVILAFATLIATATSLVLALKK